MPIYIQERFAQADEVPRLEMRKGQPPGAIAQKALDTYGWANDNALSLLAEAKMLSSAGHHARAFALASTSLEEIGKSQFAADVYTGFVPPDGFEKLIRNHEFKSAYPSRFVEFGHTVQPFLKDEQVATALFERRNEALYASPAGRVDDVAFEQDARVMIDYCNAWIERIRRQEAIAERIGTRAFIK